MSAKWRLAVLFVSFVALAVGYVRVASSLHPFGVEISPYAAAVNDLMPGIRHVSNMVAAVNFDVRGFDTLGEETMLLCAVTGTVVLLRGTRGESGRDAPATVRGRSLRPRSDATVLMCRIFASLLLTFGIYVVLHGTVTPGGGFQGGVIAASGILLVYLGEGYQVWRAVVHSELLDVLEGTGALLFVAAAAAPLAAGRNALENMLPLGTFKDLYSGGLMLVVNVGVALAVFGGFASLLLEFLEETRSSAQEEPPEGDS